MKHMKPKFLLEYGMQLGGRIFACAILSRGCLNCALLWALICLAFSCGGALLSAQVSSLLLALFYYGARSKHSHSLSMIQGTPTDIGQQWNSANSHLNFWFANEFRFLVNFSESWDRRNQVINIGMEELRSNSQFCYRWAILTNIASVCA